jgi:hypothetical protein
MGAKKFAASYFNLADSDLAAIRMGTSFHSVK